MLNLKELEASLDKSLSNETHESVMAFFQERDSEKAGAMTLTISYDEIKRIQELKRKQEQIFVSKEEYENIIVRVKKRMDIIVI